MNRDPTATRRGGSVLLDYEAEQDAYLRRGARDLVPVVVAGWPVANRERPPEPARDGHVWYRGWEVGYSWEYDTWGGEGWLAYKGGCDLDASMVAASTYAACLDEVDDREDEG